MPFRELDAAKHAVGDVKRVSPVVIRNAPVVLADSQNESRDHIHIKSILVKETMSYDNKGRTRAGLR